MASGTLRTLRPIHGRVYAFTLDGEGELKIDERDPEQGGVTLQLLDPGQDFDCGDWGGELPVRMRELHSHWYCR